ncbi:MAG: DNA gyrase subunit B, partial [Pirellulaceae bacterium]
MTDDNTPEDENKPEDAGSGEKLVPDPVENDPSENVESGQSLGASETVGPVTKAANFDTKANEEYSNEDIQHLSDMEHVRARPAMYIGDLTARGLHHLVYEVVDNS